MKKAIVTGANGFVGSWLVKELVKHNIFVYAVVRSIKSNINNLVDLKDIQILYCELEDLGTLKTKIECNIDLFFHFAWAGTSGTDRGNYNLQLDNVRYACDAVKIAKAMMCRKFIFAGSIMEYESMEYIINDTSRPGLGYIYSSAKLAADFMAKTIAVNEGLDYSSVIISNIYGEGEKSNRFINTTLKKFINHDKTDFSLGEQLYDFIYVTDAVNAIYLVGVNGKPYTNYYIGNTKHQKLKKFIIEMKDCIDNTIELNFGGIPFDGPYLKFDEIDTGKLENELQFSPQVSFKDGIMKTIEWLSKLEE